MSADHGVGPENTPAGRVFAQGARWRIVGLNSSAVVSPAMADAIIVCGSHGAPNSALWVRKCRPGAAIFHDAGKGKDNYSMSCLGLFDEEKIPCACVDAYSARIADAIDMYETGVISAVNETAAALGLRVGMSVKQATNDLLTHLDRS
jgi:hypothetical protein